MYKYYFFDLDGTLTDSAPGIINSVVYALKKYNINVVNKEELRKFVGPPLVESFVKYYGFSKEQAVKVLEDYREYFIPKGMFENSVYQGIEKTLNELRENGKKLYVVTSKPEIFSVKILEHFHLIDYFDGVFGATLDEKRVKKQDVIQYAIDSLKINDKSEVVMIGDRDQDMIGAKINSIDCIGVLWGYGSMDELIKSGAKYTIKSVQDILKF